MHGVSVSQAREEALLGYYTFYTRPGGCHPEVWWMSRELALRDHRVAYTITHERWRALCSDRPCRMLVPTASELRFGRPLTPRAVVVLEDEHETTNETTGAPEFRTLTWWYISIVVLSSGDGDDGSPVYGGSWLWPLSEEDVEQLMMAMQDDPDYATSPLLGPLAPTKPLQFEHIALEDYVERVTDFSTHPNKQRVYATMMYPMSGPLGDGIRETESEQLGTGIHLNFATARSAWLAKRPPSSSRQLRTDQPHARASQHEVLELHRASLRARLHSSFEDALPEDLRHYLWMGLAAHLADRHTAPLPRAAARTALLNLRLVCREADAAVREVGDNATIRLMRAWMKSWAEGSDPGYCAWLRFFSTWYGLSPLDVERQMTKAVLKGRRGCQLVEHNASRSRWILFLRLLGNVPTDRAPPAVVRPRRAKPKPKPKPKPPSRGGHRVVVRLARARGVTRVVVLCS